MVIAIVGMSGSGKSELGAFFRQQSLPVVHFGKIIIAEMTSQGIDITPDNEREFREGLRTRDGKGIFAELALPTIKSAMEESRHVVIDSLYSLTEYKTLKGVFGRDLIVVAVVAPKKLRYERLQKRLERPLTPSEAEARDLAEVENIEKGGPIALADYTVINDGEPSKLFSQAMGIVQDLGI